MFSAFQTFGRLGAGARAVAAAWSPLALWPTGTEPGMWIDPSNLASQWQDSTGTTPVSTPGTVADSSNPVGLALDLRLGATALTDPGNHMFQATSTARPLLSARVNLLTYSEDFSNAVWAKSVCSVAGTGLPDGIGGNAGTLITFSGEGGYGIRLNNLASPLATATEFSLFLKYVDWRWFEVTTVKGSAVRSWVDLQNGVAGGTVGHAGFTVSPAQNGWVRVSCNMVAAVEEIYITPRDSNGSAAGATGNTGKSFKIFGAQAEPGLTATTYQRVGAASDYDATGITPFQIYDGTDDGMATASFAAGTLTSGMDCLIAVRRDSAANAVCGLYESVAEANKVFGIAESGSSSGCVGSGAGTPTVWVDNTQLTGGTAVTRGTLHTALTAGTWHILEFRGLDLSTWTASGFGLYTSYKLPGARGDIMLYPSTASTTDKDAARQYLADLYGVTLP